MKGEAMTQRIDLATTPKPLRDFIRNLGTLREPIELVAEGTVVAKLVPPTELTDEEKQRILAEGWEVVQRARAQAAGRSPAEIQKEVDQAVREVRERHAQRRR
jgi:hypothetical protein